MRYLLAFLGIVALAGGVFWWQNGQSSASAGGADAKAVLPRAANAAAAAKSAPVRVTAVAVARRDVPQTITLAATVYANATVALKSRLDSQIMTVHFQDGDRVEKGALLFTLDDRALKAQQAALQANLQRDMAQLKTAKAQYERSQKLSGQGFVTTEKLEQDKAAYATQEAGVAASKATLDNLKVQLDYTTIRAPISGRAGTIAVTEGNTVKANDTSPLVTINQIDPILVQFAVPQRHYDALRAAMARGKMSVVATRAETGASLTGVLEYIDNAIDMNTGTFVARARFDNPQETLWPGMFVDVGLTLETLKDALVIPGGAVQGKDDKQFVYVVKADKKAERRAVTAKLQDDLALIAAGLQADELVVSDGLLRVTEGALLDVVAPSEAAADKITDKPADKTVAP